MELFKEEATSMIPVTLGEAEIRLRGQELAAQLDELNAVKDEKKRVSAEIKGKEDYIQKQIKRLSEIVKTGVENFEQPCLKVYDIENKLVWWELTNGSQYHKRDMRDDELEKARAGDLFESTEEPM